MPAKLKPLDQQVIVITGASSGIGLTTAKRAAKAGATVLLAARSEDALREACEEINAQGGRADYVVADVGERDEVAAIAEAAVSRFGGFDTWVNDAGVGIYGNFDEIPYEDHERLFRTNYFGVVHGSLEAVRHLKGKPEGGVVINIGSILSDMAVPLMGPYVASKHAVKGFTDSLRLDLQRQGAPIQITLIKPASIGTPFPDQARNYMDEPARVPPPVYAPEVVADAILHAATHPVRHLTVGGAGRQMVLSQHAAPDLADRVSRVVVPALSKRKGQKPVDDNLYTASPIAGREHTDTAYSGRPFSLYTQAHKHPALFIGAAVLGLTAAFALRNLEQISRQAQPILAQARSRTAGFRPPGWTRRTGTPGGLQSTLH